MDEVTKWFHVMRRSVWPCYPLEWKIALLRGMQMFLSLKELLWGWDQARGIIWHSTGHTAELNTEWTLNWVPVKGWDRPSSRAKITRHPKTQLHGTPRPSCGVLSKVTKSPKNEELPWLNFHNVWHRRIFGDFLGSSVAKTPWTHGGVIDLLWV